MYSLDKEVKSFAVANDFVAMVNKSCYALGQYLRPFCIFGNDKQREYGVTDIATFGGMRSPDISLVQEIAEERAKVYKDHGILANKEMERTLFIDYLLSISICYVEVPKYVTKNGVAQESFDKFLCTKNPAIMGTWMGASQAEMQAKYSAKIQSRQVEFQNNEIRVAKLITGAKGNSISIPRSTFFTDKMTCIPMFMLYAFIEGFKPRLFNSILKFSYLKDNGTVRELATTLSESILMDYYEDTAHVAEMLSGVDINTVKQGGLMLPSKMNRGYIRLPELGSSVYDTGVRSLNLARILSVEVIPEVDRSFIHVDLNSVVDSFCDCMDYLMRTNPALIKPCYQALSGDLEGEEPVALAEKAKSYVSTRSVLFSTTYHRELHMFMSKNPQWFPLYTGTPSNTIVRSSNAGAMPMEF